MASAQKNSPQFPRLTRGVPALLGTITAAGDVVQFTIPEPTYQNAGQLIIVVAGGITPSCVLELSIDQGYTAFGTGGQPGTNKWVTYPTVQTTGFVNIYAITGQPGADPAATFGAQYNIAGLGSGAVFRFGRTDANGGAASVWALVG